jgi:DNA-binding CsgD family transcriptional regulator
VARPRAAALRARPHRALLRRAPAPRLPSVDAGYQLAGASATFHALGGTIWGERAERELGAAGYSRPSPAQQSPWAELTAAETRVARVILEGATYDEAASALFVSPRTIESHLRQIYRKVGVRSRSEMTRRLAMPGAA